MNSRKEGRDIQAAIRQVLLDEWDPLGAKAIAPSEYDAYIGRVYRLLVDGASPRALAEFLSDVERDEMGLSAADPSALLRPAEALYRLKSHLR